MLHSYIFRHALILLTTHMSSKDSKGLCNISKGPNYIKQALSFLLLPCSLKLDMYPRLAPNS